MTETLLHPEIAASELHALLYGSGIAPLDDLGWLRVTGEDRVRWLNGMVTNSIQDLADGEGNYNFVLNAQGRIQGTATAFAVGETILLETSTAGGLATLLDHFIIMDDVDLTVLRNGRKEIESAASKGQIISSVPHDRAGLLLAGPNATETLTQLGIAHNGNKLSLTRTTWQDYPADVIAAWSTLIPRYELWSTPETIALLQQSLTQAGALPVTAEALEHLRLLEGTPLFGTDIRDTSLPQETAQTQALHFAKGCYLGQEIVERIRSRGQVHRTLHGFRLEGELPAPNTSLIAAGKPVGELTSAAAIPLPTGTIQIALGTIRREALATALTYSGGTAHPILLPYTSI